MRATSAGKPGGCCRRISSRQASRSLRSWTNPFSDRACFIFYTSTGGSQMKIFVAGGTGAIGRPLIAELLAKGHAVVALTRSPKNTHALVQQGIEHPIADVFDADAVKAVVSRAQPEVVIEQLTALPRTYTRESMNA